MNIFQRLKKKLADCDEQNRKEVEERHKRWVVERQLSLDWSLKQIEEQFVDAQKKGLALVSVLKHWNAGYLMFRDIETIAKKYSYTLFKEEIKQTEPMPRLDGHGWFIPSNTEYLFQRETIQ